MKPRAPLKQICQSKALMARSRRKKNGRQKALDGWTTQPTGREESALVNFVQETDFKKSLQSCEADDRDREPSYWNGIPVGGIYFTLRSELDFDGDESDLDEQPFALPAELRPTADDLQHLERLEIGLHEVTVIRTPITIS